MNMRYFVTHAYQLSLLGLVLLCCYGQLAVAEPSAKEHYRDFNEVGTGSLIAKTKAGYVGLARQDSKVHLRVSGMLVHGQMEQHFHNDSDDWLEATYVFPLPPDSAVDSLQIKVGEQVIEGVIQERQQARQTYIKAKQQGKQTALLEQQRPNLFTTRVANIAPGASIVVSFSYLQQLQYRDNAFSLRLPLTLTPRYIPGQVAQPPLVDSAAETAPALLLKQGWGFATSQVPDAGEITPPQQHAGAAVNAARIHIQVDLEPGFTVADVQGQFHELQVERQGAAYSIQPRQNPVVMNRDFVLTWKPVAQQQPSVAFFQENLQTMAPEKSRHGLLMLMPPRVFQPAQVPARELIIVVDTSGSMAGDSMLQAKLAVSSALARLRPIDRFNVIEFNSTHQALFNHSQLASSQHLQQAQRFVSELHADGSTEMYGALNAALQQSTDTAGYLRQVVFITDGSVGNEQQLLALIRQQLGVSRLYTIGIGAAPNTYFMRKAAEFGKGTYTLIGSQQQVQQKMQQLFSKIEQPVLTDLKVDVGVEADLFPQQIPDLYQGEPLLIHARFAKMPKQILVSGRFDGKPWQQRLQLQAATQPQNATGVATLWARQKVQHLADAAIQLTDKSANNASITALGLEYQIVTPFTSFVAVAQQPVRNANTPMQSAAVANLMPAGSQQAAVGFPQTALGLGQRLLWGSLALLAALLLWCKKCRPSALWEHGHVHY